MAQLSPHYEKPLNRHLNKDKKGCEEHKVKNCHQAPAPSQVKEETKHHSLIKNSASASRLTPQPVAEPGSKPSLASHTKILEELQQSQFRGRKPAREILPKVPPEVIGEDCLGHVYAIPLQGGRKADESGPQVEQQQYHRQHEYEKIDEDRRNARDSYKVQHQHEYAEINAHPTARKALETKTENQRPQHEYAQIVECQKSSAHVPRVSSKEEGQGSCASKASSTPLPNIPTPTPDTEQKRKLSLETTLFNAQNHNCNTGEALPVPAVEVTPQSAVVTPRTTKLESETGKIVDTIVSFRSAKSKGTKVQTSRCIRMLYAINLYHNNYCNLHKALSYY